MALDGILRCDSGLRKNIKNQEKIIKVKVELKEKPEIKVETKEKPEPKVEIK